MSATNLVKDKFIRRDLFLSNIFALTLEVIKIQHLPGVNSHREKEEEEESKSVVLAPHRHLFAKELRRNFVSQDSATVPLELSATQDRVGDDGTVGLWERGVGRKTESMKVTKEMG